MWEVSSLTPCAGCTNCSLKGFTGNPTDERKSALTISLEINIFSTYSEFLCSVKIKVSIQTKIAQSFSHQPLIYFNCFFTSQVSSSHFNILASRSHAGSVRLWKYIAAKGEVKCLSWVWCTWITFLIGGHCSVPAKELTDACACKMKKKG